MWMQVRLHLRNASAFFTNHDLHRDCFSRCGMVNFNRIAPEHTRERLLIVVPPGVSYLYQLSERSYLLLINEPRSSKADKPLAPHDTQRLGRYRARAVVRGTKSVCLKLEKRLVPCCAKRYEISSPTPPRGIRAKFARSEVFTFRACLRAEQRISKGIKEH